MFSILKLLSVLPLSVPVCPGNEPTAPTEEGLLCLQIQLVSPCLTPLVTSSCIFGISPPLHPLQGFCSADPPSPGSLPQSVNYNPPKHMQLIWHRLDSCSVPPRVQFV